MMQQYITSHKFRVKRAEDYRKNSPEKISIFDREALVEFFLLEDVVRLYEYRLKNEHLKLVETRAGVKAKQLNIEKFTAIINIFKAVIEVSQAKISSGDYSDVWKAIPEHALMKAASSVKYLQELREIAVTLLRTLSDEAMSVTSQNRILDSSLDELEDHEANVRRVMDIPTPEEIEEIIKAAELAIPNRKDEKKKNIA